MNSKSKLNRRQVLRLAGTGAVVAAGGSFARSDEKSRTTSNANDRVRLGVIGCGGMGTRHLEALAVNPHCEVAAVCDCFTPRYENAVAVVKKFSGKAPVGYQDFRRVLDRPDIDAILRPRPTTGIRSW